LHQSERLVVSSISQSFGSHGPHQFAWNPFIFLGKTNEMLIGRMRISIVLLEFITVETFGPIINSKMEGPRTAMPATLPIV
jgi:hypothetical protein